MLVSPKILAKILLNRLLATKILLLLFKIYLEMFLFLFKVLRASAAAVLSGEIETKRRSGPNKTKSCKTRKTTTRKDAGTHIGAMVDLLRESHKSAEATQNRRRGSTLNRNRIDRKLFPINVSER